MAIPISIEKDYGTDTFAKNVQELADKIRQSGKFQRVLLQLPNGLRHRALEISHQLEKSLNAQIFVALDPMFGACDLPMPEAETIQPDVIAHVGHRPFYRKTESKFPVVYYDWPMDRDFNEDELEDIKSELRQISETKIGIIHSVQYQKTAELVSSLLSSLGKDAKVGGYVLGCWTEPAKNLEKEARALLFVGTGKFHPFGFSCKYNLDLEKMELEDISKVQLVWEKKRQYRIASARDAQTFAILVSSKPGQFELLEKAEAIKEKLQHHGKKGFIVAMDMITSESLQGIRCDAFINTACPRLNDDEWDKPFINADDLEMMLNGTVQNSLS